jgi:hypothetical protein
VATAEGERVLVRVGPDLRRLPRRPELT